MNYQITSRLDRDAQHLVEEVAGPDYCREHVTLTQDAELYLAGTVLKSDGAGKAIRYDGTGEVLGLLYAERDAADGDIRGVANVRATVYKIPLLVWAAAVTDVQKTAAMESMKSKDLIGRPAY